SVLPVSPKTAQFPTGSGVPETDRVILPAGHHQPPIRGDRRLKSRERMPRLHHQLRHCRRVRRRPPGNRCRQAGPPPHETPYGTARHPAPLIPAHTASEYAFAGHFEAPRISGECPLGRSENTRKNRALFSARSLPYSSFLLRVLCSPFGG